ncbi:MAG: DegT/DnrJ/EryC1/StrS family aminotransferase [Elusimicrobia bacterium]|nr:DegT/DnrJ/EryC1/StrS family aminotransferase [Elusimicrobiota bacterium]
MDPERLDPVPFLNLASVHEPMEEEAVAAFRRIYRKNEFILGEEVRLLEEEFARASGAAHGVGMSSGTAALELSLRALNVGPGDDVLTTPFSFFATAAVIAYVGARPVFVDIDPGTLNLDPRALPRALTPRTKAILPVHLFGQPADMDAVNAFADAHSLNVVEDACQAHAARWRGRPVGALGRIGCFSFYPTKNLGGFGDGGIAVTNDGDLAERLRRLRNCGRRAQYEHLELGYNERLDNLQAALLRIKLPRLAAWTEERRRLADLYRRGLAGSPARPLAVTPGAEPVYHLFTVRAPRRDALKDFLAARGLSSGVFYPTPLHLQPAFAGLGGKPGDFPEAERASVEALSLPLYPGLSENNVLRIIAAVRAFYES